MDEKFIRAHTGLFKKFGTKSFSYCDPYLKNSMHRAAVRYMRLLAAELGLPPNSFDVRSNKAGIACSGEITLHGNSIYVQVSESFMAPQALHFLIRGCKSRKDYSGMGNNFVQLKSHNVEEVFNTAWREMHRALGHVITEKIS